MSANPSEVLENKIPGNRELIVPGIGAETVLLHQNITDVAGIFSGYQYKLSKFKKIKDIFKDIYNIKISLNIQYDKIYHYDSRQCTFFSYKDKISAIIGLNSHRVTNDSVDLKRGIEYFVFHYGNKDMIIKKRGNHKIYIYYKIGIALIDDNSDNSIDMFIIFPVKKK